MAVSLSTNIIIVTLVFSVVAILAVGLRFIARIKQGLSLSIDDYLVLPALFFTLGLAATTIVGVYAGHVGTHVTIGPEGPEYGAWFITFEKVTWWGQLITVIACTFIKASLLLFYRRLFRGETFRLITAILLGIICCWAISFSLAIVLQCIPVSQAWLPSTARTGHCYSPNGLSVKDAMATSNMLLDVAILIVPQPIVWKLNMPIKRRIAVSLIFLLGFFVVAISAARIYFFYSIAGNPELEYDVTYNSAAAFYWTNIDVSIAIVCTCLPTIHSLVAEVSPGRFLRSIASKVSLRALRKRTVNNSIGEFDSLQQFEDTSAKSRSSSARSFKREPTNIVPLSAISTAG